MQVGELTLTPDAANRIAYGADTEFTVNFTNQGENDETDIVVVLRIDGGPEPLRVQKSVASVPAGTAASATLALDKPPPLDTPVTITVAGQGGARRGEEGQQHGRVRRRVLPRVGRRTLVS